MYIVDATIHCQRHRRADSHGEVVANAIVANTFAAARRRKYVDGNRAVRHRSGAESQALQHADYGKSQNGADSDIADVEERVGTVAEQQHFLAW